MSSQGAWPQRHEEPRLAYDLTCPFPGADGRACWSVIEGEDALRKHLGRAPHWLTGRALAERVDLAHQALELCHRMVVLERTSAPAPVILTFRFRPA